MIIRLIAILGLSTGCKSLSNFGVKLPYQYEEEKWPDEEAGGKTVEFRKKTPDFLPAAQKNCTAAKALRKMGIIEIQTTEQGEKKSRKYDFSQFSGEGLKGGSIESVLKHYEASETYKDCTSTAENRFHCKSSTVQRMAPELMNFCSNGPFPRDSLENAALVAVATIDETQKRLAQTDVPKIMVLMEPHVRTIIQMEDGQNLVTYRTDNAIWTFDPHAPYSHLIAILPHSEEFGGYFRKARLWEQPSVIAHEWGHHVFWAKAPGLFKLGKITERGSELGMPIWNEDAEKDAEAQKRIVNEDLVVSALNEGFADLVAYSALAHRGAGAIFLGGEILNRDVSSAMADDGRQKEISMSLIKHFFSYRYSSPDDAHTPDHQDVHAIGTILAAATYSLWKDYHTFGLDALPKKWLETINAGDKKPTTLVELLGAFVKTSVATSLNPKCHLTSAFFPAFTHKLRCSKR